APPPNERCTVWLDNLGPLPTLIKLGNAFDSVRQIFDTFVLELNQPGAAHRARVTAALWELYALLADVTARQGQPRQKINDWQRARMRLEGDLSRPLQISELADELGLSVDHFIRGFKKRYGLSPKQCRTQALMRYAAHRLTTEDVPIKRLAFELGFADSYSFTRAFKQNLGILPTQLRSGLSISERAPRISMKKWEGQDTNHPRQIFKMNQHVLPYGASAEIYQQCMPIIRGRDA
ncbi:MAG TPA: AraC family transcriptional regulator, partial [Planctomycetota bacterium]|nr:AraC family transcriptional regulator [Planctomycetota bacterium]